MQRVRKTRATHRHGPRIRQDRHAKIRDGMLGLDRQAVSCSGHEAHKDPIIAFDHHQT